ncbi:hypothetical protein D3C81_1818460 [compost metagenome]
MLEVGGVFALIRDLGRDQEMQAQRQRAMFDAVGGAAPGRAVEREFLALDQVEPQRQAFAVAVFQFLRCVQRDDHGADRVRHGVGRIEVRR